MATIHDHEAPPEAPTDLDRELNDALAPEDAPTDDELEEYFDAVHYQDLDVGPGAPKPPFHVDTYSKANWAARKIAEAQARIDQAQAWRDEVVAKADALLARERSRHLPKVEFFEHHLTDWLRREIEADTSTKPRKSRDLDGGVTVKLVPGKPRLIVEDEDALVDFLTTSEDAEGIAKPKWEYSKTDVKNLILKEGIAVKGAHVETGEPGYKIVGGDA